MPAILVIAMSSGTATQPLDHQVVMLVCYSVEVALLWVDCGAGPVHAIRQQYLQHQIGLKLLRGHAWHVHALAAYGLPIVGSCSAV